MIWADSVEISDGSVLHGKLIGIIDGNLTIQTSFAGKIKVPVTEIESINSDKELSLRLEDNRTFDGIIEKNEEKIKKNLLENLDKVKNGSIKKFK